jgi:hypothetical protein
MPKSKAEAAKRVLALNLNEVYEPASVIAPALGQFLQKFGAPLGQEVQEIASAAGRERRVAIGN